MINFTALALLLVLQANHHVIVNSSYRTPEHNKRVGGKPHSKHIYGKAFDLATHHLTKKETEALIRDSRKLFDTVIIYQTHIHVHIK